MFIDFTARWCASCQVNKRIYKKDEIIEKFKDLDIVALQADWTKRGSDILKELQSYGREGVPLYVYHPPKKYSDQDENSVLLPEILTEKIVLDVLDGKKINSQSDDNSFWAVLGFAFIGGVVLNLMPCVFPVIGLKILSFVKQAGEDPVQIRLHGFVFTFGVVLSFWVLVGLLLFLRERLGNDIGWGFQLQEPVFVFILAVFLLIFALNLSGVFEIGLFMTGIGGHLTQKNGYMGTFFLRLFGNDSSHAMHGSIFGCCCWCCFVNGVVFIYRSFYIYCNRFIYSLSRIVGISQVDKPFTKAWTMDG